MNKKPEIITIEIDDDDIKQYLSNKKDCLSFTIDIAQKYKNYKGNFIFTYDKFHFDSILYLDAINLNNELVNINYSFDSLHFSKLTLIEIIEKYNLNKELEIIKILKHIQKFNLGIFAIQYAEKLFHCKKDLWEEK